MNRHSVRAKVDMLNDSLIFMGCGVSNETLESAILTPKEFAKFNRPDAEKTNVELAEEIILIIQRSSERFGSKRRRMMLYDDPSIPEP